MVDYTNMTFWFSVLIAVFFFIWVFYGGKKVEPIGIKPLQSQSLLLYDEDDVEIDATPMLPNSIITPEFSSYEEYKKVMGDKVNPDFERPDKTKGSSYGETICRNTLEEIYGKPFPKVRPDFLRNPSTNKNMELDCYNEELKIAVEYNGIQHYIWPNFTGMTKEEFTAQIRRDNLKYDLCEKAGVYLITVPYNTPEAAIPDYIKYYLPENVLRRKQILPRK